MPKRRKKTLWVHKPKQRQFVTPKNISATAIPKKTTHLVHLKDSTLLNHYPNTAKNFIFMPIPVRKLSVKTSHMMLLKKRFLKQAKNILTSLQTKKLLKS